MENIELSGVNIFFASYIHINHWLSNFTINYPRYSLHFYSEKICPLGEEDQERNSDHQRTLEREKSIWLNFTRFNGNLKWSMILVAYWAIYVAKFVAYLLFMVNNVDFKQIERNIWTAANGESQFACIKTNCTKLSNNRKLAEDLIRLPLLAICKPQLKWPLNPMIGTHLLGLMLIALMGFCLFSLNVLLPLFNLKYLLANPTLMFILCPNVSVKLARKRTSQLWDKLNHSYRNFKQNDRNKQPLVQSLHLNNGPMFQFHVSCSSLYHEQKNLLASLELTERKLHNSMPINRTSWWHEKLVTAFGCTSLGVQVYTYGLMFGFFAYVNCVELANYRASLMDYAEYIDRSANCSLSYLDSDRRINLRQLEHHWNWWTAGEFLVGLQVCLLNMSAGVTCLYQAMNDIKVIMSDLSIQLRVAAELAKWRSPGTGLKTNQLGKQPAMAMAMGSSALVASIRQQVFAQTEYSFWSILRNRRFNRTNQEKRILSELESQLACQQFSINLLNRYGNNEQMFVELLESIQINYWHLGDIVGEFNLPVELQLHFAYLINFGFSFISLYFYRKSNESEWAPLFVNLIAIGAVNSFIVFASTIHSEARKLQPLLWSLIGRTANDQNARIRHLNHLWSKQLNLVDARGGLSLRAFGSNITYVRIIEILLWTTSIMLFAYTRQ